MSKAAASLLYVSPDISHDCARGDQSRLQHLNASEATAIKSDRAAALEFKFIVEANDSVPDRSDVQILVQ